MLAARARHHERGGRGELKSKLARAMHNPFELFAFGSFHGEVQCCSFKINDIGAALAFYVSQYKLPMLIGIVNLVLGGIGNSRTAQREHLKLQDSGLNPSADVQACSSTANLICLCMYINVHVRMQMYINCILHENQKSHSGPECDTRL